MLIKFQCSFSKKSCRTCQDAFAKVPDLPGRNVIGQKLVCFAMQCFHWTVISIEIFNALLDTTRLLVQRYVHCMRERADKRLHPNRADLPCLNPIGWKSSDFRRKATDLRGNAPDLQGNAPDLHLKRADLPIFVMLIYGLYRHSARKTNILLQS